MVFPIVIAGLCGLALGALVADAEPDSKLKLQNMIDELQELEHQNKVALEKLDHANNAAERELKALETQVKILKTRNDLELEVIRQIQIQATKKAALKQNAN